VEGVTTLIVDREQDERYRGAAAEYGGAVERLARAYECDPDWRRDLLQEIHLALWRSFAGWEERCSVRTWVYRVAHNAAMSYVMRQRRRNAHVLVSLEELEATPDGVSAEAAAGQRAALDRLLGLVQQLKPLDRQVILGYLEGLDAASIGEITGLAPGNVATKIHRIKNLLSRQFHRLWQQQPLENAGVQLEDLRGRAGKFESRIRNRNRREYIAAAAVMLVFTSYIFIFPDWITRLGSALILAGTIYVVVQLYRRSTPVSLPADFGLVASVEFYRRELVRQRDLGRSVWRWYLGPLVPGMVMFTRGKVLMLAIYMIVFGLVWWVNQRGAARLTRQIEELDRYLTS